MLAFFLDYLTLILYTLYIIYDRVGIMFDNKLLINLYVLSLDKKFEIFVPVNDKVGNISKLLSKSFFGLLSNKNYVILNLYNGKVYNNNDIIKNTDIQNGTKLILI